MEGSPFSPFPSEDPPSSATSPQTRKPGAWPDDKEPDDTETGGHAEEVKDTSVEGGDPSEGSFHKKIGPNEWLHADGHGNDSKSTKG